MEKEFTIQTDGQGYYHATFAFKPPVPIAFDVEIYATFSLPSGATAEAKLELDGPPGSAPQSKAFLATPGQKLSLGSWHIARDSNVLIVSGKTTPALVSTPIKIHVEADLGDI